MSAPLVELTRWEQQTSFAWVPLSATFAAPYERPLSPSKVEHLMNAWDVRAVGVLYLAERKSTAASEPVTYAILDGRHRIAAAVRQELERLPSLIYHGLSYTEEALLYVAFATVNRQTSMDRFRARLEAGDEVAREIQNLARDVAHVVIGTQYSMGSAGYLNCVWTCENIYTQWGPEVLAESFRLIREVWGDRAEAWTARVVHALAAFVFRYQHHENYKRARAVERLRIYTPSTLVARAHVLSSSSGYKDSRSSIGQTILEAYNDGLGRRQQLPDWITRGYALQALHEGEPPSAA